MTVRVRHLIPSCMTHHGPSGGILAQLRAQDPATVTADVWSMYPPPPDRDPSAAVTAAGGRLRVLGMSRAFGDVRVLPRLVAALRAEPVDVLHCHLVRANLYGRVAGAAARVPVVINTLRNVEDYFVARDVGARVARGVERATAPLADHHVAVSEGVRRAAIEHLGIAPDRITTVLNAVDLAPFESPARDRAAARAVLGLRTDALVLGSAGLLEPRKNHAALVRIVAALVARGRDVQAVVVGEGSARSALEAQVAALGLADRVRMPGFHRDVPAVLAALDVFVMTSFHEGLPRAVMEAMAAGVPCVVSDAGGTAEAVVEGVTGHVHRAADEAAFVATLDRLLADPDRRAAMGVAARREAFARFAPARMAAEYTALYRRLLDARRGRRAPRAHPAGPT